MDSKNKGFTLIELLIVIAIIAILITIAVMSGSAWLNKTRVETQTKTMFVNILDARTGAMKKNRIFFVKLENMRYTVYEDTYDPATPLGKEGDGVLQPANDTEVLRKDLQPAYAIQWSGSNTIEFNSRGLEPNLLTPGSQNMIRVTNNFGSADNCITVAGTRVEMGSFDGTSCVVR